MALPAIDTLKATVYLRTIGLAILLAAGTTALVLLLVAQGDLRATTAAREQMIADLRAELALTGSRLAAQERLNARLLDGLRDLREDIVAERQVATKTEKRPSRAQPRKVRVGGGSKLLWPADGRVTSGFGDGRRHQGIDIAAWTGMPVRAAAKGTVVHRGWEDRYGNFLVIDHGEGRRTLYSHLEDVFVGHGSTPSRGTVIATAGCTGNCSGPHLHFEVLIDGVPVDPLRYLP